MKILLRTFTALAISVCSSTTMAEDKASNYYLGISTGTVVLENSTKDPINAAVNIGYNFSEKWALEGQYTTSIRDGEYDSKKVNSVNGDFNYQIESLSAYGVFRSGGKVYVKGKAGLADDINSEGKRLTWGAGIGYRASENPATNIELEATALDSGATYYSLGVNFGF
ncbi:outer membrane beta-barrel protein [Simiduia curdlanivorans]|uniref:Outer membrane beta-barrel protein n=1 Tax=Simiduia curdlanivorans TaxID=1492769 RepID=A0ABV8V3A3_9GAMM|nr:outer membrane beta-barrel protein [Simiduia curdlanivorans]MDN3640108.1 outer membrane beta-barrel protein [Simiduia curdlanivorans]